MARKLEGTVFEMLEAERRRSVGCTVNGEAPMDIMQQIKDGELEVPDEGQNATEVKLTIFCRDVLRLGDARSRRRRPRCVRRAATLRIDASKSTRP